MNYTIVERTPSVEAYNRVRHGAGLTTKDEKQAARGLANSLFAVCALFGQTVIGIGRIIGDGGLFYDIVDVAVVAEYQGKGVGDLIMQSLMRYLDANAGASALICLMANRGLAPFYERYGFTVREPDMPGMIIRK